MQIFIMVSNYKKCFCFTNMFPKYKHLYYKENTFSIFFFLCLLNICFCVAKQTDLCQGKNGKLYTNTRK